MIKLNKDAIHSYMFQARWIVSTGVELCAVSHESVVEIPCGEWIDEKISTFIFLLNFHKFLREWPAIHLESDCVWDLSELQIKFFWECRRLVKKGFLLAAVDLKDSFWFCIWKEIKVNILYYSYFEFYCLLQLVLHWLDMYNNLETLNIMVVFFCRNHRNKKKVFGTLHWAISKSKYSIYIMCKTLTTFISQQNSIILNRYLHMYREERQKWMILASLDGILHLAIGI